MTTEVNNNDNKSLQSFEIPKEDYDFLQQLKTKELENQRQQQLDAKFKEIENIYKNDPEGVKSKIWDAGLGEVLSLNKDTVLDEAKLHANLEYFSKKAVELEKAKLNSTPQQELQLDTPLADANSQAAGAGSVGANSNKNLVLDVNDKAFFTKQNLSSLVSEGKISDNDFDGLGYLYGFKK